MKGLNYFINTFKNKQALHIVANLIKYKLIH